MQPLSFSFKRNSLLLSTHPTSFPTCTRLLKLCRLWLGSNRCRRQSSHSNPVGTIAILTGIQVIEGCLKRVVELLCKHNGCRLCYERPGVFFLVYSLLLHSATTGHTIRPFFLRLHSLVRYSILVAGRFFVARAGSIHLTSFDIDTSLLHAYLLVPRFNNIMMRFITIAALAVSALSQNVVVTTTTTTAPLTLEEILQITTLGGMTFRVLQEPNQKYTGVRRGPLAMARAYSKYGVAFPDDLLAAIERLLEELGLSNGAGNGAGGNGGNNSTSGQGM